MILCEHCGRECADLNALYQHTKAKHSRRRARTIRRAMLGDQEFVSSEANTDDPV